MSNTATADTQTRILDAAVELFAEHGFGGTSLREVTRRADVNIAAVNYHFGSKDALIKAALLRMLEPVNKERLDRLAELEGRKKAPTCEELVGALIGPIVCLARNEQGLNLHVIRLTGRCLTAPPQFHQWMRTEVFPDIIMAFGKAFQRCLPHLSQAELRLRFQFVICMMLGVMARLGQLLEEGSVNEAMLEGNGLVERMAHFLAAGMEVSE